MKHHNLSIVTAMGCMTAIGEYTAADYATLGITRDQFRCVSGKAPWTRDQRRTVVQTLEALMFGTSDILGLARITLPAEYVAAVISSFVSPVNRMVACIWMAELKASGSAAADLAELGVKQATDYVSANQLFGIVVQLSATSEATMAREMFEERLGDRIAKASTEDQANAGKVRA